MGFSDSFMRFNTLVFHQSRLMELSGALQLFSVFCFNYLAILHHISSTWVDFANNDKAYGFLYFGMFLISLQTYLIGKVVYNLETGLYPTAQSIKVIRLLLLMNGYVMLPPMFYCTLSVVDSLERNLSTKSEITSVLGFLVVGGQMILTVFSSYLNLYYKLPLHQGIGRFDRNSQASEIMLLLVQGLCFLLHTPILSVSVGILFGIHLSYRGYIMPSFQSISLCQVQLAFYWSYLFFMVFQLVFLIFPNLNLSSSVFSVVQGALLFYLLYSGLKPHIRSFLPDINAIRITQALLKGHLTQTEYNQKLPLLVPMESLLKFLVSVHFLSNFNLVEEIDSGDTSNGGTASSSKQSNDVPNALLSSRHKGHCLLANTVYNCLNSAEKKLDNCAMLKCNIVRYCWMNFGVIEDKTRAVELENQIILGKRTILSSYTLILVSTIRKLKDLVEFSSENDLTVLMKDSFKEFCAKQLIKASTSLYALLKAANSEKDAKLHILSHLFVDHAYKSFHSIKELFQKYPQDPATLRLLASYFNSVENDLEAGDFVVKTMQMFDTNRGVEKDILDISAVTEEENERSDSFVQFDYVGKFLLINENMKKNRFQQLQWQKQFHYALKISIFILFASLVTCVLLNGYLLMDYVALQLSFSQVASTLPFKRQRADESYFQSRESFSWTLLELEECTTNLIYMGRLDSYATMQFLDASTIKSPSLINATQYTLIDASYLDANLDHMILYTNLLLPSDLKRAFISFVTMNTSILQNGRLNDFNNNLKSRFAENNLNYFEYSFLPIISASIILIATVVYTYLYYVDREKEKMLVHIRTKTREISELTLEIKTQSFSSVEDHYANLASAVDSYNIKVKSSLNNFLMSLFLAFSIVGITAVFLYLIFTVRQEAIDCAYFQTKLASAASNILFSFYHIQSLGYLKVNESSLVSIHQESFYNAANFSLLFMAENMAELASQIRDPFFVELSHSQYYKGLILDKNCESDICDQSLDFEVNEFVRSVLECFTIDCNDLSDRMNTAIAKSSWKRLEDMMSLLVLEDLLTKRRSTILVLGLCLTVALLFVLTILIKGRINKKQQTLSGYVYI
eukprot:NODE_1_length_95616_cov_0.657642.p2 type:complete len:1084 gc:universal NODE_1_length_95616_cov_0.657642:75355-72104(-)